MGDAFTGGGWRVATTIATAATAATAAIKSPIRTHLFFNVAMAIS
jgi:hypothetical protein